MSKALQFTSPPETDKAFDSDYEYRVFLNDEVPIHICAPGDKIEIKRIKKPKPITADTLVEFVAEQLLRDGEIKDSDELAQKILEFRRARAESSAAAAEVVEIANSKAK